MTKQEQVEEMMLDVPQVIVAYDVNPKGQHLYGEQRQQIAESLYDKGYGNVSEYRAEIKRLEKENAHLLKACEEQFTFNTTTNKKFSIFNLVRKEFADKVKEEVVCNLFCKGTAVNNTEEMNACMTMARQLLYRINRLLNEDYGFDEPLCASDQFKVEPELVKKYKIDELLKEYGI